MVIKKLNDRDGAHRENSRERFARGMRTKKLQKTIFISLIKSHTVNSLLDFLQISSNHYIFCTYLNFFQLRLLYLHLIIQYYNYSRMYILQ